MNKNDPVAFYDPHKGFYWAKPTKITAPVTVDVEPLALYTQRTWVGLTEQECERSMTYNCCHYCGKRKPFFFMQCSQCGKRP